MKKVVLLIIAFIMIATPVCGHGDSRIAESRSYWLFESSTGTVLAEYESSLETPAASLTKLMTCLLTLEAIEQGWLQWDENITLPAAYINPGGSSIKLEAGQNLSIRQLVEGMLIASGNDAANLLADRVGGSEAVFVKKMNERAKALGMKQTRFLNATGLPTEAGENMTSAADIGLISEHLIETYQKYLLDITSKRTYRNTEMNFSKSSTNTLMILKKGVDGLKTGHTNKAGYCTAVTMPFLDRADARLIAVVMGTPSEKTRDEAAKSLLDWAEEAFRFRNVIDANQSIAVGNWEGLISRPIQGHPEKSVECLLKVEATSNVTVLSDLPEKLPLMKGDVIGKVTAELPDGGRVTVPLISDTEILDLTLQERVRLFFKALGDWFSSKLPS